MKEEYLLDTHVWLWCILKPSRLSVRTKRIVERARGVWLSPISIWEASMLSGKGRLSLRPTPRQFIRRALKETGVGEVVINHEVALQSQEVQLSHDDPADRFLAATASVYELTLLTADERLLNGKGFNVQAA